MHTKLRHIFKTPSPIRLKDLNPFPTSIHHIHNTRRFINRHPRSTLKLPTTNTNLTKHRPKHMPPHTQPQRRTTPQHQHPHQHTHHNTQHTPTTTHTVQTRASPHMKPHTLRGHPNADAVAFTHHTLTSTHSLACLPHTWCVGPRGPHTPP